MKVVTSEQMRTIESELINGLGIPSIILMENAAHGAAEICMQIKTCKENHLRKNSEPSRQKVCVYAGTGNNGGDGFAIARHLYTRGINVGIYIPADPSGISGDALINLDITRKLGIPLISDTDIIAETRSADYVVDAMLGTGLCRQIDGGYAHAIEIINNYAGYVVAIDIPTGVNGDTGKIMGDAVKADQTITIGLPKLGLYLFPACSYVGEISCVDICIPDNLIEREKPCAEVTDDAYARALLPMRTPRSNKGNYGKVFVLAGSEEMPGAACLASLASYRVGAGLVRACTVSGVAKNVQKFAPEVVSSILPEENGFLCQASFDALGDTLPRANTLILGPGLGLGSCVDDFVYSVTKNADIQMVLDADALNSIAKTPDILHGLRQQCVITPHPGEMGRLTGMDIPAVMDNIIQTARLFSARYNVVTVLKDARTIIAHPNGAVHINISGTSAMAKAGSGDVLTGIIGGLMAQGISAYDASILGCHIHGRAGEAAERSHSVYSVIASDIINCIPQAMKYLQQV